MKNTILIIILFIGTLKQVSATNYYIRTDGNDNNNGLSNTPAGAWRSINTVLYGYANWQNAIDEGTNMLPGDTLYVNDGFYAEDGYTFGLKIDNINGTNTNRFVLKAINKWAVHLELTSQFNAFNIENSTGITIDGFDIYAPDTSTNIFSGIAINNSEYVTIRNCKLHNFGLSGVGGNGQNIIIEYNHVYNNSIRNQGNGSGINFYHPVKISDSTLEGGYGHIIRGNTVYGNYCEYWYTNVANNYGPPTDGNGIIIDDWNFTQQQLGLGIPYVRPCLIENNICFDNGGAGITIYNSNNVTVRNNTCYNNSWVLSQYANINDPAGGIVAICEQGFGDNITIVNNISMTDPTVRPDSTTGIKSWNVTNITIQNNYTNKLTFTAGPLPTPNVIGTTPQFVNPSTDPMMADFHLLSTSPAVNIGFNTNAAIVDFDGNPRPGNGVVDAGAYEVQTPLSINLIFFTANVCKNSICLSWKTSSEINNDFYTVQKSIDGITWKDFKVIKGARNSQTNLNYETIDEDPFLGKSYYRLKQTDIDGAIQLTSIVSVFIKESNRGFTIYPNPVLNIVTISGLSNQINNVKIYNSIYQDVTSSTKVMLKNNSNLEIDMHALVPGQYYIKIMNQYSSIIKL